MEETDAPSEVMFVATEDHIKHLIEKFKAVVKADLGIKKAVLDAYLFDIPEDEEDWRAGMHEFIFYPSEWKEGHKMHGYFRIYNKHWYEDYISISIDLLELLEWTQKENSGQ
jgi:hypothetical protein